MRCITVILLALSLSGPVGTANGKVVGILFDDSGSMTNRINLSAFGAQLLVSTLDGRDGKDRLFTARMTQFIQQPPYTKQSIATRQLSQRLIDDVATNWTRADGGTPYLQIEILLEALAAEQRDGEDAFLIIFTDGEFNQPNQATGDPLDPPPGSEMAKRFRNVRQKLKGPLRVDFMLMNANHPEIVEAVNRQGMRDALLGTFNGDVNEGRHDVTSYDDMIGTLETIIARVSRTERSGIGEFVQAQSDRYNVSSPFAITRIVTVSTSEDGSEPVATGEPAFDYDDRFDLKSRMANADQDDTQRRQLRGLTTHIVAQPALPAGDYSVPLVGSAERVFLLFETETALRLSVVDENNVVIGPGADGRVELPLGSEARLIGELIDAGDAQPRSVNFDDLPSASVEFQQLTDQGDFVLTGSIDSGRYVALIPTRSVGEFELGGSMRIDGFISTYAAPLPIRVIDNEVTLSVDIEPIGQCLVCKDDEIGAPLLPREKAARVVIDGDAPIAGRVRVNQIDMPAALELVDLNGQPIQDIVIQNPGVFRTEAQLRVRDIKGKALIDAEGVHHIKIALEATGLASGAIQTEKHLKLFVEPAELRITSHLSDLEARGPLILDAHAIDDDSGWAEGRVFNVHPTGGPGQLIVEALPGVVRWTANVDKTDGAGSGYVRLEPHVPWWCHCFLKFYEGAYNLNVTWENEFQRASTSSTMELSSSWSQVGWGCLTLLLLALMALYSLLWLRAWITARRFPRGSGVAVSIGARTDPIFYELRHWNWTPLKALTCRSPQEVRSFEGLALGAARVGAEILLPQSNPDFRVSLRDETLQEILDNSPTLRTLPTVWGEQFELADRQRITITLLRSPEELYHNE